MAMWITRQRLGWLSLILGVVGFTLPWASYAGYEDSYVVYEMWNGWRSMGELFIPFVSPISLLVAGVELFPIIAAVVAIALPHARKIWWWMVASSLSLLALVYHIWLTLDSAQEFGQRPEPTY